MSIFHGQLRLRKLLTALVALGVLTACEDAPTVPHAYLQPADGVLWGAITVPPGVPHSATWLPYLRGGEAREALVRVRDLQADARRARLAGDLASARAWEAEAVRVTVQSMSVMPSPVVLHSALAGLDGWMAHAQTVSAQHRLPELDTARALVAESRAAATEALQAGDTVAAVAHLAYAAERVREQAPAEVAGRALARVERRLQGHPADETALRALRLMRTAREAIEAGDGARALQRALYALQLAEQVSDSSMPAENGAGFRSTNGGQSPPQDLENPGGIR